MDRKIWHRRGPKFAVPMMVFSLIVVGCGGEDEAAEMEVETGPPAPTMPAATEVQALQLQTGAAALAGQTVRVNGLKVVSKLGAKGFWVELPNKNPFLVMTADNATVNPQDMVDVVGSVVVMNDSILGEWVTSGAISENQKLEAEFATEFLQAQVIQAAAAMAPMGDSAAGPN